MPLQWLPNATSRLLMMPMDQERYRRILLITRYKPLSNTRQRFETTLRNFAAVKFRHGPFWNEACRTYHLTTDWRNEFNTNPFLNGLQQPHPTLYSIPSEFVVLIVGSSTAAGHGNSYKQVYFCIDTEHQGFRMLIARGKGLSF